MVDQKKLEEWERLVAFEETDGLDRRELRELAREAVPALLAERASREALLAALRAERFDPHRREVTICGVRYSIDLFEHLGVAKVGEWVRVEKREGETLTLRRASAPDWPAEREGLLDALRDLAAAVREDCRRRGAMTPEVLVALDAADDHLSKGAA